VFSTWSGKALPCSIRFATDNENCGANGRNDFSSSFSWCEPEEKTNGASCFESPKKMRIGAWAIL
jgi:hypothetical protein